MEEFLTVFLIQATFIFLIDNKYRLLSSDNINQGMLFQALIATMYVVAIPLIAKGTIITATGYIIGSVLGTYLSHIWHKRKNSV